MKRKKQTICGILSLFCLHRFYLGKPISALVQIFTGGGLLIWYFIDIYQIVKCEIKDSNGNEIE